MVTVAPPPAPPPVSDPALNAWVQGLYQWAQSMYERSGSGTDIISTGAQEGTSVSFTNITATGNITVGGTVDGRDLGADGTKLDGVEALADVTDTANVENAGAVTSGGNGIDVASNSASIDLATSSGLEFTTGQLRIEEISNDATVVAVGSVSVNIGGTTRKLLFG